MAPRKETTIEERQIVMNLYSDVKSEREIAKIVSRPRSTVNSIIKHFKTTGTVLNKIRSGRPPKVNDRLRNAIIREVKKDPRVSAPKIATNVAESVNVSITPQTIRNVLHKDGYHGRVSRRKFLVSSKNKAKRMIFAIDHTDKPQKF